MCIFDTAGLIPHCSLTHVTFCMTCCAGKTSLLRLLAGKDAPDAGTVRLRRGTRIGAHATKFCDCRWVPSSAGSNHQVGSRSIAAALARREPLSSFCPAGVQLVSSSKQLLSSVLRTSYLSSHSLVIGTGSACGSGACRRLVLHKGWSWPVDLTHTDLS